MAKKVEHFFDERTGRKVVHDSRRGSVNEPRVVKENQIGRAAKAVAKKIVGKK